MLINKTYYLFKSEKLFGSNNTTFIAITITFSPTLLYCNHHHITRPHLHPFGPQGDSGRPAASIPWSFVDPISAFGIPYGWRLEMKNELYLTHVITDKTWSWDSEVTRFHQRDTGFVLYINIIHILICWWYRRICLSFCVFLKLLDFITPNYSRVQKPKTNFGTQTCQDSYK
jgi:hypothetical protein